MKPRIGYCTAFISVIVCFGNAVAGTVYVDNAISVASSTSYDPQTRTIGSGANTVYKTLSSANAVAGAGTTIVVRAGTYPESISPAASGTATAAVVYRNYPNETVFVTGATAIVLNSRNYTVVDGFHAEDTRWVEANNSHYNTIQNCVFKRTPATGTTGNVRFVQSHYNNVLNNVIETGNDNLLFIDSNYNVAEGNTIREGRHSLFGIRCGDGNVIRRNYFSNTLQKIGEVYDCGADTTAVPNSFNSTARNVIEDNIFAGTVKYYSSSGGNGIQYAGQKGIIRYNVFYNCNIGLGMQVYPDEALYNTDNRIYNNTFYNNAGAGIATSQENSGNVYKNNILFANQGSIPDCFATTPGQLIFRNTLGQSALFTANNLFYSAPGQPVIEEEFDYGYTIAQTVQMFPGALVNTFEVDPQFVNAAGADFNLRSTSPMIDRGDWLTRTRAAGSGTVIPVQDASYFSDRAGRSGAGDELKLQGQTTTARVTALDLVNNTVTVNTPMTWTSGQGVGLEYLGSAPEIGAFEFDSGTTTPPPPPPPSGDASAPTVAIQSPANGASVSGTVAVSATASDDVGVVGVRFLLNGAPLGAEVQTPPYLTSWNTTALPNGTHALSAIARDASGKSTTSATITVNVKNRKNPRR